MINDEKLNISVFLVSLSDWVVVSVKTKQAIYPLLVWEDD